ncbi:inositol monophosphatase family protein [Roseitranquillus sediminis]|uniref:inositol monophosphatase family protein n=1 Tax=Roseitranquillus sediminis TaxID=2809051 RepID=UPI001D0C1BBA|nr:inositol monophosphatase family protein [Roseitranquillus sediminis]MBM9595327.1 inositol monophosphatase family protein [Roseitranquillus sediminis]
MRHNPDLIRTLLSVANALADAARLRTLQHFRAPDLQVDDKGVRAFDPVTAADRAAEEEMRRILAERRPEDAVLGEEGGATTGSSGLTWILDPVDGTRGFLAGTPTWGVLIAVADANGPFIGLIDQPYIGERFVGSPIGATFTGPRGPARLRTRPPRPLPSATLFTTYPEVGTAEEGAAFRRVASAARLTRYGMDCYAYALVAAGHVDLVIEAALAPHDIAAPIAVIEAAGGVVTDWSGGSAAGGGQVIAAANPGIHREALALLAG